MDDKSLHEQLNRPRAPQDLEDKIRANWHAQMDARRRRRRRLVPALATAAALLLALPVVWTGFSTPTIVTAAVEDIAVDAGRDTGLAIPVASIVAQENIRAPLAEMTVKMTKNCTLDKVKTVHMQVAGARQGEVHLFINDGELRLAAWQSHDGQIDRMRWQFLSPREHLTVLVLYSDDMSPANVARLVQHMFYG